MDTVRREPPQQAVDYDISCLPTPEARSAFMEPIFTTALERHLPKGFKLHSVPPFAPGQMGNGGVRGHGDGIHRQGLGVLDRPRLALAERPQPVARPTPSVKPLWTTAEPLPGTPVLQIPGAAVQVAQRP